MKPLFDYIKGLMESKFYGEIVIKFFAGEIRHIEKKESINVKQFN